MRRPNKSLSCLLTTAVHQIAIQGLAIHSLQLSIYGEADRPD